MRHISRVNCDFSCSVCLTCQRRLYSDTSVNSLSRCKNCDGCLRTFRSTESTSKFKRQKCTICLGSSDNFIPSENSVKPRSMDISIFQQIVQNKKFMCIVVLLLVLITCFLHKKSSDSYEDLNISLLKRFKKEYPSQKNETWYHVLSVLETKIPSVKSIIFLHGEDKKTSTCLTNELVSLYTANRKIKMEEITFSVKESEAKDYGFSLKHYHTVVEKFGILVTDLTKVSGNIARIFHYLCDEISSDIKPSLFIFTLKYDKKTESLKPMERAVTILKEVWSNLPQSEISPLLSRIIKNVVDIVPEREVHCSSKTLT